MALRILQRLIRLRNQLHLSPGQLRLWDHPIKKWYLIGYGLTALCLIVGVTLKFMCDNNTLSYAGALIIVLGIYLTWQDIRARLTEAEKAVEEFISNAKSSEAMTYNPNYGKLTQKRLLTMEATILAIGTITWAFGGLPWFSLSLVIFAVVVSLVVLNRLLSVKR